MRAVVVEHPGGPEVLTLRDVPVPTPAPGWVLIRVEAFGLNRSEFHFRSGVASTGSFPRIPGIEAVGTIAEAPGGEFPVGTRVAAMMGGMGRTFDGGYAEYATVPSSIVVPFTSELAWDVLGAVPEMLQTAAGSLRVGLEAVDGQSLLIRGGTSSIGLALATIASLRGMTVLSTTRNPASRRLLEDAGVDHVIIDDGDVAAQAREIVPGGVDGAVELVGGASTAWTRSSRRIPTWSAATRAANSSCSPGTGTTTLQSMINRMVGRSGGRRPDRQARTAG